MRVWVCTSTSPPIYVNIYMCVHISTQGPRFILVVSPRGTCVEWAQKSENQFRRGGRNHQLLTGRSTQHAVPRTVTRPSWPRRTARRSRPYRPSSSGESSTSRLSGLMFGSLDTISYHLRNSAIICTCVSP